MAGSRSVVRRHQFADYLKVPVEGGEDQFYLMGTGFTSLDENPGAQTDTKQYVNEKASSKSVTGYETVFPFESDFIPEQPPILALYNVGRNHCVGTDAEFEYVRVELWDAISGQKNVFPARKFTVSAEISEVNGDPEIHVSGNLNAVGDPIDGTFDTEKKTFTEATASE